MKNYLFVLLVTLFSTSVFSQNLDDIDHADPAIYQIIFELEQKVRILEHEVIAINYAFHEICLQDLDHDHIADTVLDTLCEHLLNQIPFEDFYDPSFLPPY